MLSTPPESTLKFSDLALIEPLLRAVEAEGYTTPTPIQERAIPHVLAGKDVLGTAQTGTGKTAAFALPILQGLATSGPPPRPRHPRVLILTPTRELATQIGDSFATYGKHTPLRHTVIFGGVGQSPQVNALRTGVDVLVATPGRLIDLIGQRLVNLEHIQVFVLDEADRMLDMGFIHDVRRVIEKLPKKRQTLFFSATMPPEIKNLADSILTDPIQVGAGKPVSTTADNIEQSIYFVEKADKRLLLEHLLKDPAITRALVFTRTKHGANRVTEALGKARIVAGVIHGNKSQGAREKALADFKSGRARVLVATDIAARGIDIEDISHVINFDLPNIAESYVHRIGRTARAGASGIALSFCDTDEREFLRDIERLVRTHLHVVTDHPFRSSRRAPDPSDLTPRGQGQGQGHGQAQRGQGGGGGGGRGQSPRGQGRPPQHHRGGGAPFPRPAPDAARPVDAAAPAERSAPRDFSAPGPQGPARRRRRRRAPGSPPSSHGAV